MLKELASLGNELKVSQAIPGYDDARATIETVQTYAFANKVLHTQGEPSWFFMHKDKPPPVTQA